MHNQQQTGTQPKAIRIATACKTYEVSRTTLYRRIKCGDITATRLGRSVFLSVQELDGIFLGTANAA